LWDSAFPFPEEATLILCGFLIAADMVRPVPAFVTIYSEMLIADYGLHFVGRKCGLWRTPARVEILTLAATAPLTRFSSEVNFWNTPPSVIHICLRHICSVIPGILLLAEASGHSHASSPWSISSLALHHPGILPGNAVAYSQSMVCMSVTELENCKAGYRRRKYERAMAGAGDSIERLREGASGTTGYLHANYRTPRGPMP
jgi:hypothetical protein